MKKIKIDWIKTCEYLGAISALVIVLLTYLQLKEVNDATKAEFAHKFKTDFFTEQSCILITLFDYDLLKFKIIPKKNLLDEFGYFVIDTSNIDALKKKFPKLLNRDFYTPYELDNFLLNHFDDLGQFYKGGVLNMEYIYSGFDYYVELIHENEQIKKYLGMGKKRRKFKRFI